MNISSMHSNSNFFDFHRLINFTKIVDLWGMVCLWCELTYRIREENTLKITMHSPFYKFRIKMLQLNWHPEQSGIYFLDRTNGYALIRFILSQKAAT